MRGRQTNMLWISTKSKPWKPWKTRKDVTENILQENNVKRVVKEGKKANAADQELKNQKKKEQQQASQDQGVGSPFWL